MKVLQEQLYRCLAGELSISQFETWLYAQDDLMAEVVRPGFMLDLVSLDYRKRSIQEDLRSLVVNRFGNEDYLLGMTYWLCKALMNSMSVSQVISSIDRMKSVFKYDLEYGLYRQFYYYDDVFDLSLYSRAIDVKENIIEIKRLASSVIRITDHSKLEQKIQMLEEGIEFEGEDLGSKVEVDWERFDFGDYTSSTKKQPFSESEVSIKRKKWYVFWN